MKYQLVLQFPGDSGDDLDAVVDLEDRLRDAFGRFADVDGHDIGSGQANIFIFTSDPAGTFEQAKPLLLNSKCLQAVVAAYRDVDGEDYTVIWPRDYNKQFKVL